MKAYRVGSSWKVTIVEYDPAELADESGGRPSDRLIGMAVSVEEAGRIVDAMNYAARAGRGGS